MPEGTTDMVLAPEIETRSRSQEVTMLIELEGVLGFVLFAIWIWALIDCITTERDLARNLPKGAWLIIVILLFNLGAILWFLLGRPAKKHWRPSTGPTDYPPPRRRRGIEDRPSLPVGEVTDRRSAELDRQLDAWEAAQKSKAADEPHEAAPGTP